LWPFLLQSALTDEVDVDVDMALSVPNFVLDSLEFEFVTDCALDCAVTLESIERVSRSTMPVLFGAAIATQSGLSEVAYILTLRTCRDCTSSTICWRHAFKKSTSSPTILIHFSVFSPNKYSNEKQNDLFKMTCSLAFAERISPTLVFCFYNQQYYEYDSHAFIHSRMYAYTCVCSTLATTARFHLNLEC
jgi:hypothetical protein